MYAPTYYRARIPRASWTRTGKATVTVRVGGTYEVYLCVGQWRIPLHAAEAWGVLAALETAMPSEFGAAPEWFDAVIYGEAA
ncbi:MAG: hypothetical protein GEV07_30840 [Streptosporangiales bacterium]|nr:hypothetical protein [Streptosporangiales bacterium]